jgi:predicted dehydrogenase
VIVGGARPGLPFGQALRNLVRAGKVGTVTYVTAADRRRMDADGADAGGAATASQLMAVAIHQLDDLARMFEADPVRMMARLSTRRTEAWLELSNDIRVHYDGALAAGADEHELWIDGEHGALRVERGCLWWRRRGWRWFVPVSLRDHRLETAPEGVRDARRAALRETALEADRQGALLRIADLRSVPASPPAEPVLAR